MNNDLEQFSENMLEKMAVGDIYPTALEQAALARIALSAKQAKPVAFTGSGSLSAIKVGHEGYIWGTSAEAHPIELYTTQQPAHAEQDGWIKCSERMPDSKNDVQLFCSDTREQFVGFHRGNGRFQFFCMNGVIGECEPTHWMPLPAAPKPESE